MTTWTLYIINKSILDYVAGNSLKIKEYYESKNDSLYSLAAMYAKIDTNKRYNLLMKGLNNDIFRPAFKGEDLFDRILIESIDVAYENYWINKFELENALRDGMLKTTGTAIDKIMPPISRFGGDRAARKQGIIEKLMQFFEKYFGLV